MLPFTQGNFKIQYATYVPEITYYHIIIYFVL